jgi:hypothetical protein
MAKTNKPDSILWVKGLLNSLLVLVIGFAIFMVPALIKAFQMGFELGPQSDDPAALSRQISETISNMYKNHTLYITGFVIITILLIFWRARVTAKGTGDKCVINGILVSIMPVLLTVAFISAGFNIKDLLQPLFYIGAGTAGGLSRK